MDMLRAIAMARYAIRYAAAAITLRYMRHAIDRLPRCAAFEIL